MTSHSPLLTTTRLLELARNGDDHAIEELYHRYLKPLRRWAKGRLPRWARGVVDTDDLVQESLLGSLRTLPGFAPTGPGGFNGYLHQAIRNRLRDELRRARVRPAAGEPPSDIADLRSSPVEEAIGREMLERYEAALARLAEADREAVLARVELRQSYAEIAAQLGKPSPDAARMAVQRAITRLAREMALSDTR